MSKFLGIILLLIFIASCSLDNKTGLWTKKQKIKEEKIIIKELFEKEKTLEKEFNPNLKINLSAKLIDNSFINNFDNNNGRVNYNGTLKSISKFKFSKIDNFNQLEPEIILDKNNVIFFDDKGSILKSSLTSANTGVAPTSAIDDAEARKELGAVITSSP